MNLAIDHTDLCGVVKLRNGQFALEGATRFCRATGRTENRCRFVHSRVCQKERETVREESRGMGGGEVIKKGWLIKSPPLDSGGMKVSVFFHLRRTVSAFTLI